MAHAPAGRGVRRACWRAASALLRLAAGVILLAVVITALAWGTHGLILLIRAIP